LTDEAPVANMGAMEKVSNWKRAIPPAKRQLFMQTMAGDCAGGHAVRCCARARTPQSVQYA
jgi:hypothetical protein